MNINILNPEEFNKDEIKFLTLLGDSEDFEKIVKVIRFFLGLPENGIKVTINNDKKVIVTDPMFQDLGCMDKANPKLFDNIDCLLHIYRLPIAWACTLYSIITLNIAVSPMRNIKGYKDLEIEYLGGLGAIERRLNQSLSGSFDNKPSIQITIREGMSFETLIKRLSKQKSSLSKYLNYLPQVPKILIRDIEIKKEINDLTGKLRDSKIGEHLETKYGQKLSFDPNYETISKYRSRYLRAIKNIPKNKYSLYYLDKIIKTGH